MFPAICQGRLNPSPHPHPSSSTQTARLNPFPAASSPPARTSATPLSSSSPHAAYASVPPYSGPARPLTDLAAHSACAKCPDALGHRRPPPQKTEKKKTHIPYLASSHFAALARSPLLASRRPAHRKLMYSKPWLLPLGALQHWQPMSARSSLTGCAAPPWLAAEAPACWPALVWTPCGLAPSSEQRQGASKPGSCRGPARPPAPSGSPTAAAASSAAPGGRPLKPRRRSPGLARSFQQGGCVGSGLPKARSPAWPPSLACLSCFC
mmetsp:Transcript_29057/g.68713  ORF Transcript_29057/g.68713 Transcript_29057/m.68713 type:complete len:266 (-) Transcript_29057:222-1019(-)